MLNSCAEGVTVVNIDNGFGAAYAASLINREIAHATSRRGREGTRRKRKGTVSQNVRLSPSGFGVWGSIESIGTARRPGKRKGRIVPTHRASQANLTKYSHSELR
jgi:hypothetical protein